MPGAYPEASPIVHNGAIYGATQKSLTGGGLIYRLLISPDASITSVTETGSTTAIARGTVNPNGENVSAFFEYSLNANFAGSSTTLPAFASVGSR